MMRPGQKTILFDFDGVFVDTFSLCFNLSRYYEPSLTADEYRKRFEGNIYDALRTVREYSQATHDDFFGRYAREVMKLPIIDGIGQAVIDLSANYALVIISSTITSPVYEYLELHELTDYFEEMLGSDMGESKVAKIHSFTDRHGVSPGDCVFITDTLGDLREASEADVGTLAVTWGFHNRETLAQGNPSGFINSPADMQEAVELYFE